MPFTASLPYGRWRGIDERQRHTAKKGMQARVPFTALAEPLPAFAFRSIIRQGQTSPREIGRAGPSPARCAGPWPKRGMRPTGAFLRAYRRLPNISACACKQRNFGRFGKRQPQRGFERAEHGTASQECRADRKGKLALCGHICTLPHNFAFVKCAPHASLHLTKCGICGKICNCWRY